MSDRGDLVKVRRQMQRRQAGREVEIQISDRALRMLLLSLASARAVVLVGPPGTGKTQLLHRALDYLNDEPDRFGFANSNMDVEVVTPEEDWGFNDLVLGETIVDGDIRSQEGELLQAIQQDSWLMLDEMNRADMDRIFGGLLTWLSGNRTKIGNWDQKSGSPVYLEWDDTLERNKVLEADGIRRYIVGRDWRLVGTYNAVDAQRVYRMGQALSRRFKHVPIAPPSHEIFSKIIPRYSSSDTLGEAICARVTALYRAHFETPLAQLGPGLFTDIPLFVENAVHAYGFEDLSSSIPSDESSSVLEDVFVSTQFENFIAEGYFVSVASVLSRMDHSVLKELCENIIRLHGLRAESVEWLVSNLEVIRG